ncbi:hypothetical protein AWRI1631_41570 [Saccharomyces cerevisiae AWRI1631]|uniref:Uncharacterized protein n=1 Tax=Saccharomyces cerevisiae (strain AWRI1631) TaxID=545124 RepID=B5VFI7_YEAS6|nr:hypothetical protein AWRI1631_41570 [Saccharomyces cerevisiae AWRI1631]
MLKSGYVAFFNFTDVEYSSAQFLVLYWKWKVDVLNSESMQPMTMIKSAKSTTSLTSGADIEPVNTPPNCGSVSFTVPLPIGVTKTGNLSLLQSSLVSSIKFCRLVHASTMIAGFWLLYIKLNIREITSFSTSGSFLCNCKSRGVLSLADSIGRFTWLTGMPMYTGLCSIQAFLMHLSTSSAHNSESIINVV